MDKSLEALKFDLLHAIRFSLSDAETRDFHIQGYSKREIDNVLQNIFEESLFRGIECHSKDGKCWKDIELTSQGIDELSNHKKKQKIELLKKIYNDSIGVTLIKEDGAPDILLLLGGGVEIEGDFTLKLFQEMLDSGLIKNVGDQIYQLSSLGIKEIEGKTIKKEKPKLNPSERLSMMKEISEFLQEKNTSSEIDILMEGYDLDPNSFEETNRGGSNRLYVIDILKKQTDDLILKIYEDLEIEKIYDDPFQGEVSEMKEIKNNKVFVVHGHDEFLKKDVEIFLYELGLKPIILHKQPSRGKTIIEKIEKHTDVKYAIVLYTPDDEGISKKELATIKEVKLNDRARQNVVFEHGYLMGKLKRENVLHISKGEIEQPTDIGGIVYISENDWKLEVIKELKDAGIPIK